MLLYNLTKGEGGRKCSDDRLRKTGADSPPELLNTIDVYDPLDVFHPPLSRRSAGCRWMWSLGECRHRCLRQITTFRRRRIKPQRPRGIERMLIRDKTIKKVSRHENQTSQGAKKIIEQSAGGHAP